MEMARGGDPSCGRAVGAVPSPANLPRFLHSRLQEPNVGELGKFAARLPATAVHVGTTCRCQLSNWCIQQILVSTYVKRHHIQTTASVNGCWSSRQPSPTQNGLPQETWYGVASRQRCRPPDCRRRVDGIGPGSDRLRKTRLSGCQCVGGGTDMELARLNACREGVSPVESALPWRASRITGPNTTQPLVTSTSTYWVRRTCTIQHAQ